MARYYFCQWCLTYLCCPIYRNIRSGELKREYKKLAASTFLFHLLLKSAAAAASSKADLLLSLAFQSNIRCCWSFRWGLYLWINQQINRKYKKHIALTPEPPHAGVPEPLDIPAASSLGVFSAGECSKLNPGKVPTSTGNTGGLCRKGAREPTSRDPLKVTQPSYPGPSQHQRIDIEMENKRKQCTEEWQSVSRLHQSFSRFEQSYRKLDVSSASKVCEASPATPKILHSCR